MHNVDLLYYKCHKINPNRSGSYVDSPDVAERLIRTLKNEVYKYITSISKKLHVDKLDNIVDKYNNKYHKTTKMKPLYVKTSTYTDFVVENNDKSLNLKLVIRLEYQNKKIYLQKAALQIFRISFSYEKCLKNCTGDI